MTINDHALEEVTRKLHEMECYLNNTVLPQIFVDNQLILRKLTPTALQSFALCRDDEGKKMTDLRDHFRFTRIVEDIRQVLFTHEPFEKEVQSSDANWYQMKITPYYDSAPQPLGVMITFIDISDKIRRMRALEAMLMQNETVLDTISHDIRSPLTNLLLAIEHFSGMKPESFEEAQHFARLISRSIRKMEGVIGDLTETRRSKAGLTDDAGRIEISQILEDVYLSLHQDISHANATFEYDGQADHVYYSKQKIRSFLFNLVSNAIKYRSETRDPHIRISSHMEDGYLVLTVADNGSGIHPDQHKKVFEKYFRAVGGPDGTGLGLYLVKQVVEREGGRIELVSHPGDGAAFSLYLPYVDHSLSRNN